MTELQAAEKRIRDALQHGCYVGEFGQLERDHKILAHEYLRLTDETVISEEALREEFGFRKWESGFDFDEGYDLWLPMQNELGWKCRLAYVANGFYAVRMSDPDDDQYKGPVESVELFGSRNSTKVVTIGQLRMLLIALQALKGSP